MNEPPILKLNERETERKLFPGGKDVPFVRSSPRWWELAPSYAKAPFHGLFSLQTLYWLVLISVMLFFTEFALVAVNNFSRDESTYQSQYQTVTGDNNVQMPKSPSDQLRQDINNASGNTKSEINSLINGKSVQK